MEAGTDIFVPGRIAIDGRNRLYVIDRLNKDHRGGWERGGLRSIAVKDEGFYGFNDVRADDEETSTPSTRSATRSIFSTVPAT